MTEPIDLEIDPKYVDAIKGLDMIKKINESQSPRRRFGEFKSFDRLKSKNNAE
ncbi:MAG: hypothetical protein ACTSUO_01635 [Candidatus Thorarchaeota archaeon]